MYRPPIGDIMLIKYGDGKITSILDEEELTDEQKKAVKQLSTEPVKNADENTDASQMKKSEKN